MKTCQSENTHHLTSRWQMPLALGCLVLVCLAIMVFGCFPSAAATLHFHPAYDALWRGLLAQLIHLNTAHLLLNLAMLLICMGAAWRIGSLPAMPGCLLLSALAVCIGLQHETPPLAWYAGLSGALYGVAAWLALELAHLPRQVSFRAIALVACLAIGAKAVLGVDAGRLLGNMPVAHSAHIYGFIGGVLYAVGKVLLVRYAPRLSRRPA